MTRKTRHALALLFCLLPLTLCVRAQDDTIKIDTRLVVLDAQVLNKNNGQQTGGFKAGDFVLYEDNVKQEIQSLSQDKLPLSILLLLDVSGSMHASLRELQKQALDSLGRLKPEDEVSVMAFATSAVLTQKFTLNRAEAIQGIERAISPWALNATGGGTDINEGVYQAAREAAKAGNPLNRRVVITITDNMSKVLRMMNRHSKKDTEQELLESGTVVCGLVIDSAMIKTMKTVGAATTAATIAMNPIGGLAGLAMRKAMTQDFNIKSYAELTGGEVMDAGKNEAALALGKLFDHLRTRYTIGYYPANQNFDGKFRKIKLTLSPDAAKRAGGSLVVRTRQGYAAKKQVNVSPAPASAAAPAATPKPATARTKPAAPATETTETPANDQGVTPAQTVAVRVIEAPLKPLPPEAQSANVSKFSFIVYGDTRGRRDGRELQYEHSMVVNDAIVKIKAAEKTDSPIRFVLQSGDAVANGRLAEQLNVSYIDLINRLTTDAGIPYFLSAGNHDVTSSDKVDDPERIKGLKNLLTANARLIPAEGSPRRLNGYPTYAFGYGNSFFIAFDSQIAGDETQFAWVSAQLATLDRNRYQHVFLFCHHPAFSSGPHGGGHVEKPTQIMRDRWMPLFRRHKVRALFSGHEHFFEHWVEHYQDTAGKTQRMDLVITGGGGAPLYEYKGDPDTKEYYQKYAVEKVVLDRIAKPAAEPGGNAYHYVIVRVDGGQVSMEVVGLDWGRNFQPYRTNKASMTAGTAEQP
ncbi:MAG: VWA domain-containing protein [Blastocatellia bacterium]